MLDDFKDSQFLAYKLLVNSVKFDKVSHAYLIDGNNNELALDFVMSFVKMLICDSNYTNNKMCNGCNICRRIDDGNYPEFKIIEPEGSIIKKEQLLELQEEFSKSAIEGRKRVYLIRDCDKMNKYGANSLLKFLEEPEDNIIALLATDNIHQLLDTIISRCQIVSLTKQENSEDKTVEEKIAHYLNIENDENLSNMIVDTIDFIFYLEQHHLKTIVFTKDLVLSKFEDRGKLENFLDIMILFYKDVIDYKIKKQNSIFDLRDIEKIDKKNTNEKLENKINCIMNAKKDLKVNANINLLIDKLVIELEGDLIGQDSRNNI